MPAAARGLTQRRCDLNARYANVRRDNANMLLIIRCYARVGLLQNAEIGPLHRAEGLQMAAWTARVRGVL